MGNELNIIELPSDVRYFHGMPSQTEFDDFVATNTPVIFVNAVPAENLVSLDRVESVMRESIVKNVFGSSNGRFLYFKDSASVNQENNVLIRRQMSFEEFLCLVRGDESSLKWYLYGEPISEEVHSNLNLFHPPMVSSASLTSNLLWLALRYFVFSLYFTLVLKSYEAVPVLPFTMI